MENTNKLKRFLEKRRWAIIMLVLLFSIVVSVLNAKNDSLIYDEDAHIPAGYSYLKDHDIRLNPEHPPLIKDLTALPLLITNPKFDTTRDFWEKNPNDAQWEAGQVFLFESGNNPDQIIFLSRLPIIALFVVFSLFIFKWTKELSGTLAGLLAFTLFALDPNILGHNHYVTTDLGIAGFIMFSFYYFLRFIRKPDWKNVLVSTFFLGLVQLVKFSSVTIFPVFFLITIIYPLVIIKKSQQESALLFRLKSLGEYAGKGAAMFVLSLVLVCGFYYINNFQMPENKLPEIMNYYFHNDDTNLKAIYAQEIINYLNAHPITRPLADYLFGVARVFQRVAGGNVTYFFGQISFKGFLDYFPVLFLIKEPLPTLFLLVFCLLLSFGRFFQNLFGHFLSFGRKTGEYLRNHIENFSFGLFILTYSAISITSELNIGFRHLFPILPFAFILVAKIISDFLKKARGHHSQIVLNFSLAFLIIFLVFDTVLAYPDYVSYFNQSVGGPKNGYQFVTDSNADWGQDLKRLKIFLDQHPDIEKLRVNYFGTADARYYLGDKYIPWWDAKRPVESGWYAISTLFLQESLYSPDKNPGNNYSWIKNKKPHYQVGTSILIYHLTPREAELANLFS